MKTQHRDFSRAALLLCMCLYHWTMVHSQTLPGERSVERVPTPFLEDGKSVTLEAVVFKPTEAGTGPWPTLIFMHGSTGEGNKPEYFKQTFISQGAVNGFVKRGWMVIFPQRRGRGASDGLYDEGFRPDRSAYTCNTKITLAGLERAKADARAITAWVQTRSDINPQKLILGGISRGGILSVVHGAEPDLPYKAIVNFVGGWIGDVCPTASEVNTASFRQAAQGKLPSLWLYGFNDPFYSIAHSKANFDAFIGAGGNGQWHAIQPLAGESGHLISFRHALWEEFLWPFVDKHTLGN